MDSQFANYKPPQHAAQSSTPSPEIIEERKMENNYQKMMNE